MGLVPYFVDCNDILPTFFDIFVIYTLLYSSKEKWLSVLQLLSIRQYVLDL